ncbi:NUDIX hydrolase [Erysipelothrix anatis]|uniref:NUDIX hydrolase n=1 Tax=Erysipelothrix anatis TaxID=2683713 RepID=UPI0013573B06|nr:NUDIX domain-containing protein [Erysipelothrix anatis]
MEKWDAYNIHGEIVEGKLIRNEPIPTGLYHLVSKILVRHIDGDYLLVQRDYNKDVWGGYFEATAGGSALMGETDREAAERELYEETGIVPLSLENIGELVTDNTIYRSFLAICDISKSSVILQDGETISFKWLGKEKLIDFLLSNECIPSQRERLLDFVLKEK